MLWKLFKLTREHRYKDPWLSALLLRERHGNIEHELYCFTQHFPTKHSGRVPDSNDILCCVRRYRALPAKWERALSTGTPHFWEQQCARESQFFKHHRLHRKRVLDNEKNSVTANINLVMYLWYTLGMHRNITHHLSELGAIQNTLTKSYCRSCA